jgi:hypothetical protein
VTTGGLDVAVDGWPYATVGSATAQPTSPCGKSKSLKCRTEGGELLRRRSSICGDGMRCVTQRHLGQFVVPISDGLHRTPDKTMSASRCDGGEWTWSKYSPCGLSSYGGHTHHASDEFFAQHGTERPHDGGTKELHGWFADYS